MSRVVRAGENVIGMCRQGRGKPSPYISYGSGIKMYGLGLPLPWRHVPLTLSPAQ